MATKLFKIVKNYPAYIWQTVSYLFKDQMKWIKSY